MSPRRARETAGFADKDGLRRAARALRVKPSYLAQIEREGGAPYVFAQRAERLYGCSLEVFLTKQTRTGGMTRETETEPSAGHAGPQSPSIQSLDPTGRQRL